MITAATLALVLSLPAAGIATLWLLRGRPLGIDADEAAVLTGILAPITGLIGYIFHRSLTEPLRRLTAWAHDLDRRADIPPPPPHQGTRETADLAQSLLALAERQHARSAYLSSFAAHVSHALKSPLTAVRGAAELMADDPTMPPETRRRFLKNILNDCDRLTRLLDDLRGLAEAEAPLPGGRCRLEEILADLETAAPGLTLSLSGTPERPLPLSRQALTVVLGHLAENAHQHGATRLSITVTDALGLIVEDDGPGIAASVRATLFESFVTTRADTGGTGLGLAIVRATLAAHGGSIDLTTGQTLTGAAFSIRLPA